MIDFPLVSICIPSYNREKIIAHTIMSVINQTYKNIEIIISDNCSTDMTYTIAEQLQAKDGRIRLFKTDTNLGPLENWKNCLIHVRGKYVKYLWSDDYIESDFIEKCMLGFDDNSAFVYTPVKWYDVSSMNIHRTIAFRQKNNGVYQLDDFIESLFLYGNVPVSASCAIFRTQVITEAFETKIEGVLDLDYGRFGAGIDAIMFIYGKKYYDSFSYVDNTYCYFGLDSDGLTVSKGEKLYPYYFSAFYWFAKFQNIHKDILQKFKAKILFYNMFFLKDKLVKEDLSKLYNSIDVGLNIPFFIKVLVDALIYKKFKKIYYYFVHKLDFWKIR